MSTSVCVVCGTSFTSKRSDAQTCSPNCRVKLNRQKKEPGERIGSFIAGPPATANPLTPPTSEYAQAVERGKPLLAEKIKQAQEIFAEADDAMKAENLDWSMPKDNPTTPAQLKRIKEAQKIVSKLGYDLRPMSELPKTTFLPTGHAELDSIVKGFPRGRITEVYGPASVGKSTLMLQTIVALPEDTRVLYLDLENAIDSERARILGVVSPNVRIETPFVLEDAGELVLEQIGNFDLIVFDSVASALVKTEDTNELGNANVGVKPRIMTSFMRKLVGPLARTTCAVVFINQEKPTIGDMYAPKWYTPGGKALEYAASLRLRLTSNKADRITREGEKVGKKVKAEITKNKVGTPDREAQFLITY